MVAEWIKDQSQIRADGEVYDYACSNCGCSALRSMYNNKDILPYYCPECGYEMANGISIKNLME